MEQLASSIQLIESIASPFGHFLLKFALTWWWLFLSFVFLKLFIKFWLYWRIDHFLSVNSWSLLEVKIPAEIDNPFRRMESVLAGMWQVRIGSNKRERWLEGKIQIGIELAIVSIEGQTHFYVRTLTDDLELLKTSIYSQFPNAEISPAPDYSKQVPADIPNKEWDMWGSVFKHARNDPYPNPYPIKTYKKFFEEQPTTFEDEPLRVDPMGQLLEGMAKLGPGEQMWVQIFISPRRPDDLKPLMANAEAVVNKIVRRPQKENGGSGTAKDVKTVFSILATGKAPAEEQKEQESILPPEMRITPGEREIVLSIEEKMAKTTFACNIRTLYIAKRDVYFGAHKATPMSYFNQFTTLNMNGIIIDSDTWTKVHTISTWFMDARRLYLRKRRQFRYYRERLNQHHPYADDRTVFYLNTEEIATIFHFPGRLTAPGAGVSRVEAKKAEAPSELPTE